MTRNDKLNKLSSAKSGKKKQTKIVDGIAVSRGISAGKPLIVSSLPKSATLSVFNEGVKEGNKFVLILKALSPDIVIFLSNAVGVVAEFGGRTSHGAILCREYGIPCVVGIKNITKIAKKAKIIMVDGKKGIVGITND